jgi:hypothetical protein
MRKARKTLFASVHKFRWADIGPATQVVVALYPSYSALRQLSGFIDCFRGLFRGIVPPHEGDQGFLRDPPSLSNPQTLQFTAAQPLINGSTIHLEPRRNLFWGVEIWQAHL